MENRENPYQPPTAEVIAASPPVSEGPLLATRGSRLAAAMIDGFAILAIVLPMQWANGVFENYQAFSQDKLAQLPWALVGLAVTLLLNGYLLATRAQSIGKVLLKIKIVTLDGQNADLKRIILRRMLPMSVLSMLPVVGGFIGIVDGLLVFRKDQLALHDQIAGTRVVRV